MKFEKIEVEVVAYVVNDIVTTSYSCPMEVPEICNYDI